MAKGQQRSNREKKKPKMDKNKKGGVAQPPASAANKWTPVQNPPGKKP